MKRRRGSLTETDLSDWARVARHITPLRGRRSVPEGADLPAPVAEPAERVSVPPVVAPPVVAPSGVAASRPHNPARPVSRVRPQEITVGGTPAGVDRATWERLRGGKLAAVRRLDLHGMTAQHAHHALVGFLRTAHAERVRCVEVITGRGSGENGGTIRRELPHWLNLPDIRPLILAASHPHALNPGSVRLLLRRVR